VAKRSIPPAVLGVLENFRDLAAADRDEWAQQRGFPGVGRGFVGPFQVFKQSDVGRGGDGYLFYGPGYRIPVNLHIASNELVFPGQQFLVFQPGSKIAVNFVDPIGGTYIYTLYSSTFMSYYVETLVRTGIIGFIIMIMLFLNVFKGLSASGLNQKGNIEVFSIRMYLLSCMIYATVNYNLNGDSPFIACFFYILGIGIHHNEFAKDQRVAKRRVSFQQAF